MPITLKAARVNKGLSQREAAKMLEISKEALSSYERGKTFPAVSVVKKWRSYMKSHIMTLFFRQQYPLRAERLKFVDAILLLAG